MKNLKKVAVLLLAVIMVASVFTACDLKLTQEQKILGAWRDSTGTVGYEFKEGNICSITYADVTVPVFNIRYNGTVPGAYTIEEKEDGSYHVTITYTIIAKSISETYAFSVNGDTLNLTKLDDGTVKTFMRYTAPETTAPETTVA